MNKKQIKFKLAELFSGPGGLALGAIRSFAENKNTIYGIEPVWANDYDADTCKTYTRNIHNGNEENVSGLQSANGGNAFKQILKDLSSAGKGYVLTPHLYKFEEYGVPQQRHRIVIIGIRKDLGLRFKVPAPITKNNYVSAREAIENPRISDNAQNHELTKQSAGVVERLKHIPAGENAWYEGIPQHLRLNVKGARMSQI